MNTRSVILAALVAALAPVQLSCSVQGYCIDCIDAESSPPDAATIDANTDFDAAEDAGPLPDACVPSGIEVCDNIDNDCNGEVDDGELAGVGATCSTDVGECVEGTTECIDGHIVCGGGAVLPTLELCDTLDNDCNGEPDDDNPEGGAFCGTDVGECHSGITTCVDGDVSCVGNYDGTDEECNGLDDDCDNLFDEDLGTGGSCGPTQGDEGECALGAYQCLGGEWQCVGAAYPKLEQCDVLDHDCDGNAFNGFDFENDARNCGPAGDVASCGNVCVDNFNPLIPDPHVTSVRCSVGECEIAFCETGHWDNNGIYADGCEYECNFQSAVDICNLADDDCDGEIDEDAVAPEDFCDPDGECADPPGSGTPLTPTCTVDGWICDYEGHTGDVSTDGANHIVPESDCDNKDNDCDGNVDDAFPLWGTLCHDAGNGICQRNGTYVCNGTGDGLACDATGPIIVPGTVPESCNGLDDDCNGTVDDGWQTGSLHDWVSIGGGVEIFRHEATRPDARQTTIGGVETYPCSRADALPWTNVTQPDAEAACQAIGARLCDEDEWQLACKTPLPDPIVVVQDTSADHLVVIEAESYTTNTGASEGTWNFDTISGYSGTGAMRALPDVGNNNNRTSALTQSPRLDFTVTFNQTGTHYIWVRGIADDTNDNRVHVGIDGTIPATGDDIGNFPDDTWAWRSYDDSNVRRTLTVTGTGDHVVSIWMEEDNFVVDKLILTTSSSYLPYFPRAKGPYYGCGWSYSSDCTTYQPATCNGNDYDYDPVAAGDQDQMTYTGFMAQCYADWGGTSRIYDMSGNVKEWTAERAPGENPIRGGSYSSPWEGISCENNFTVADDSFLFPNVGFRCCRGP